MNPRKGFVALCVASLLLPLTTFAQATVVYGVFFYSPTCPHCIDVITNHWENIQAEFSDQLRVLFIDASTVEGGRIMQDALTAMQIEARGVPMLIIGSRVLVGSNDIPLMTPGVVREGLNAGGIGLPPIPGIEALYQNAMAHEEEQAGATRLAHETTDSPPSQAASLTERILADPVANGLAIFVLIMLVLSFLVFIPPVVHTDTKYVPATFLPSRLQPIALGFIALVGTGMAFSLLAGANGNLLVLVLAAGELLVFLLIAGLLLRQRLPLPVWVMPLVALNGLAVAGYLTFVELTLSDAVCGVVGNCNVVQQSSYARIFSVPVGLLGMMCYSLILALWLLSRKREQRQFTSNLLRLLVMTGVAFSIYLTFLEPFVIGASCIWCLTSAVIMLLLLWLMMPVDAATRSAPLVKVT
jgi:uncharacterized membrane protein/thiol-disulfide isomerase/thioredoxin